MKKLIFISAAIIGAFVLTGCQGTSNSSNPATTTAACSIVNGQQICGGGVGTGTCILSTNGSYVNNMTGQLCQPGTIGGGGFPGGGGYTGAGCNFYNTPGPQNPYYSPYSYWVPMASNTNQYGFVCVDIGSGYSNTYNYSNYDYSYGGYGTPTNYCPYGDPSLCYGGQQWSSGGSTCIGVGGGDDYGISGFLGICF